MIINYCKKNRPVSSVAKCTLSVREAWGSTPRPVKSAQSRQRLATVATFLRSCVAQALNAKAIESALHDSLGVYGTNFLVRVIILNVGCKRGLTEKVIVK